MFSYEHAFTGVEPKREESPEKLLSERDKRDRVGLASVATFSQLHWLNPKRAVQLSGCVVARLRRSRAECAAVRRFSKQPGEVSGFVPRMFPTAESEDSSNTLSFLDEGSGAMGAMNGFVPGFGDSALGDSGEEIAKKKKKKGAFQSFGLEPKLFQGIQRMGYRLPTPIQRKTIPVAIEGHDMIAMARTGSGKTAAFLIPILQHLKAHSNLAGSRALVLSPTRELAVQTLKFARSLAKFTDLRIALVVGGDSIEAQWGALSANPDIIIATPGRLAHFVTELKEFSLQTIEVVVFDEADRLFEMGFADQIRTILDDINESRQLMLFSATLPKAVVEFARAGLRDPKLIRLDTDTKVSQNLRLAFLTMREEEKAAALLYLLQSVIPSDQPTIVFAATRHHVEFLIMLLEAAGIRAVHIYGNMDSHHRKDNLAKFRNHKKSGINVMVVTDVAARGIDIPLLDNTINYNFPSRPKVFVHRVGRVARQGRVGTAFSFVSNDELAYMIDLHLFLGHQVRSSRRDCTNSSPNVNGVKDASENIIEYGLREMTPSDIHYGRIPQSKLDTLNEFVAKQINDDTNIALQKKSCNNAMKLYVQTRPAPSQQSIKRAKSLSLVDMHPLFVAGTSVAEKNLIAMRNQLKGFRPNLTVFEVDAMKKGQKAPEFIRRKRLAHGTTIAERELKVEGKDDLDPDANASVTLSRNYGGPGQDRKRRLSKAERRRMASTRSRMAATDGSPTNFGKESKANSKSKSFRDEDAYISMVPPDKAAEDGYSVSDKARLDRAVLDLNPDDKDELASRNKQVKLWDRKKKKYIKLGLQEIDQMTGKRKKTPAGGKKGKRSLQEQYNKWASKSNRRITKIGTPVDKGNQINDIEIKADWRNGYRNAHKTTSHGIVKNHTFQKRRSGDSGKNMPRDEIRTEDQIRRFEKLKEKRKMQQRGIRPHKKLRPNMPRPSKQKLQFANFYAGGNRKQRQNKKRTRRR